MSWNKLETADPELAAFGVERLVSSGVAYLATIRPDGAPRVHPVTPIVGQGRLFLFMEPTSPKGHDLQRDARYAMHCSVENSGGGGGEFFISGHAQLVEDPALRQIATKASSFTPAERYILFELDLEQASSTSYEGDNTVRKRWRIDRG
ncbi:MAG: pyridoxamine 5'-phosphate oxidase family protein [Chloroflexi bacterium]|nr:pyridoxamine 5'-phosphate oxidase family protein [Chloroflexota bacterium]